MNLKGDLNAISLSELLKTLSSHRSTGVLSVTSPMGEKHIALSRGEVVVLSDPLAEEVRLGDLLVVQGHLTREKLEEALRLQNRATPCPKLGDILIQHGLARPEDIQEAVKFQVEEEIADLFTWREATFEFDDTRQLSELKASAGLDPKAANVHRVSLDAQVLILEAARRAAAWREIGERLPTPYLCFKLTPKGVERLAQTTGPLQRVLKLLQEGRTLETVVKLSCLGRFTVSKTVIQILDDGWIVPYAAPELRDLAALHRLEGRYADALNLYRRIREATGLDSEREEMRRLIVETTYAIRRAKAAGQRPEGVEVLSHKEAAAEYKRRMQIRRQIIVAACAVIVVVGVFVGTYVLLVGRNRVLPQAYLRAVEDTEAALTEGHFDEALAIWSELAASLEDRDDEQARHVREKLAWLYRKYEFYVESQVAAAQLLLDRDQLTEAVAALDRIREENPHSPQNAKIAKLLAQVAAKRTERSRQKQLAAWRERLGEARECLARKQYALARDAYTVASEGAPAGSAERHEAEEGLARLRGLEEQVRAVYQAGLDLVQGGKAERAFERFDAAQTPWPELSWSRLAREQAAELRARQVRLREGVTAAKAAEQRGDTAGAAEALKQLQQEYAEFEEARGLQAHQQALGEQARAAEELLARARAAEQGGKVDEARELFNALLSKNRGWLAARHELLPVHLSSIPPGAAVTVNGKAQGRTPLRLELPADEKLVLRFELSGYEAREQVLTQLTAEHLDFSIRLDRAALRRVDLPAPSLAPPLLDAGRLYVAAGATLLALDETGEKTLWRTPPLGAASADTASPYWGAPEGAPGDAAARGYLRAAPLRLDSERLLLVTPGGEVLEVRASDGSARRLWKLPAALVAGPLREPPGVAGSSPLVVFLCSDGQLYAYDPNTPAVSRAEPPAAPKWQVALDAVLPGGAPSGARLVSALPGLGVVVARRGALCGFSVGTGEKRWTLPLDGEFADAAVMGAEQFGRGDALTVLVPATGGLLEVDLARGERIGAWQPARPADFVTAATLGPQGLYVVTREDMLKALPRRIPASGTLVPAWQKALEGPGLPPLVAGGQLFAATQRGLVYAISAADGREQWRMQCGGRPLFLAASAKYLYVVTAEGQLTVVGLE